MSISVGDTLLFDTPPDVERRGNGSDFDFTDLFVAVTADMLNATFEIAAEVKAGSSELKVPISSHTFHKSVSIRVLSDQCYLEFPTFNPPMLTIVQIVRYLIPFSHPIVTIARMDELHERCQFHIRIHIWCMCFSKDWSPRLWY